MSGWGWDEAGVAPTGPPEGHSRGRLALSLVFAACTAGPSLFPHEACSPRTCAFCWPAHEVAMPLARLVWLNEAKALMRLWLGLAGAVQPSVMRAEIGAAWWMSLGAWYPGTR